VFVTLGGGCPTIMAMTIPHPVMSVMWPTAVISIGLAAAALWLTSQLLAFKPSHALAPDGVVLGDPAGARPEPVVTSVAS
jgi:hypothetical protein